MSQLSKHVRADVTPERVARLWRGISGRLSPAPARRGRTVVAAVLLAAVTVGAGGAVLSFTARPAAESSFQGALLETTSGPLGLELDDGSRLELDAETRIEVAESGPRSVRLDLLRGSVTCDVVPSSTRRFAVHAGAVDVRVTGTRFTVTLTGPGEHVDVRVERGSVEVASANLEAPRRLGAGERWSFGGARAAAIAEKPTPALPLPAPSLLPPRDPPPPPSARRESATEPTGARELFDLANSARRAGDVLGAARAYELLLQNHAGDPRAGLAAFELGRLRMDRLGNTAGAVQALERAIQLARGSGFREDALARLVTAHDALGASERCRAVQRSYLESYPSGVHAAAVAAKCKRRP